MFKVGDEVVCTKTNKRFNTFKNQKYVVLDIKICRCGKTSLFLGNPRPIVYAKSMSTTLFTNFSKCKCGERSNSVYIVNAFKKVWQNAKRFRPDILDKLVISNEVSKKLTKEFIEVIEKSDVPIKEKELV